jgi:diadenosine tetraphosphate (Ap4A) HIT family hydrolase
MPSTRCPFCSVASDRILHASALAVAIIDAYPVSAGHCLVVPRRHVASWFEATEKERREMLRLLDAARADIVRSRRPGGFNIGINDGPAAGQTVPHLHIHLIPRYEGEVSNPRGGVRWVIPERADYWTPRK